MSSYKIILITTGFAILLGLTASISTNKDEVKLIQNEEYKTAVNIAEKIFPELKLTLDDYKIITIENMVVSGAEYEGPEIWRITFKSKALFGEDGMMGKGGEVFIKVNLKTKEATLLGYGE